jgi:hypothetical protein
MDRCGIARRGDSGAATIEAAFVLPILLFVMFGIMELGGSLKSYSSTAGAVRAAGRAASVAGADPMADSLILAGIAKDVGVGNGQVELVVIWHAAGRADPVPAACLPAAPFTVNASSRGASDSGVDAVGACNVYILPGGTGGAFAKARGSAAQPASYYFGCQGISDPAAAHKLDCNWPGKDRRVLTSPRTTTSSPRSSDFLGVYIRVRHSYYTSILGSTLTITDRGISLLEPQGYDFS